MCLKLSIKKKLKKIGGILHDDSQISLSHFNSDFIYPGQFDFSSLMFKSISRFI